VSGGEWAGATSVAAVLDAAGSGGDRMFQQRLAAAAATALHRRGAGPRQLEPLVRAFAASTFRPERAYRRLDELAGAVDAGTWHPAVAELGQDVLGALGSGADLEAATAFLGACLQILALGDAARVINASPAA
jgi:hypothetical protein